MPINEKLPEEESRRSGFYMRPMLIVVAVLILLPLVAIVALHVPAVQKEVILNAANKIGEISHVNVELGSYTWMPLSSLDLEKLKVETEGKNVFGCTLVRLDYSLSAKWPYIVVPEIYLEKPSLQLEKNEEGKWRVALEQTARPSGYKFWLDYPLPLLRISSGTIEGRRDGKVVLSIKDISGVVHLKKVQGREGPEIRIDPDNWQWLAEILAGEPGRSQDSSNSEAKP